MGGVVRSADCAGASAVFVSLRPQAAGGRKKAEGLDAVMARVRKTALGAEASVGLRFLRSTASAVRLAKRRGWGVFALHMGGEGAGAAVDIRDALTPPPPGALLVVSSEVDGIPDWLRETADFVVRPPGATEIGAVTPLNVNSATAAALYALAHAYSST
eukprot:Hpha_TRINITY_DN2723_c0_g1::TRINITY_DN2723_c0_g1_i1::g.110381::m.110381/K03218/rlmB; 23S rRNA (guanosine2251-2'-O)-methyltransferase